MAAAVITATTVQKSDTIQTLVSGTVTRKLKKLYLEGPKATQADWFLLSTYLSTAECANIANVLISADGEAGSANVPTVDTWTYTSADAKLVAAGTVTGISRAEVSYWTE